LNEYIREPNAAKRRSKDLSDHILVLGFLLKFAFALLSLFFSVLMLHSQSATPEIVANEPSIHTMWMNDLVGYEQSHNGPL
jgi:hypothetical protein